MFNNCAYTFDVPAGASSLVANTVGSTGSAMPNLANMTFAADTYYFIALVGTPENPQVFTYNLAASSISGMMANSNGNNGTSGSGTSASGTSGSGTSGSGTSGSGTSDNGSGNGSNGTGSGG